MIEGSVVDFIENMFTTGRLYGWCDQVNEAIDELQSIDRPENATITDGYLREVLSRSDADKESALLSLVVLHRRNVPLSELLEPAYRNLSGRLYVTDFPFLVENLFDGVIPLPRSLVYDITEKLFFSIERIFEQLVKDFQRVPFANGELILFYLMLENCRLDLTAQNKELVCIILTHIELRLPAPVLDDIIAYLDANTSLGEDWAEQRRIITFGRELEQERQVVPVERVRHDSSPEETTPTSHSPELATGIPTGAESRAFDSEPAFERERADEEYSRPDTPDFSRVETTEESRAVDLAPTTADIDRPRNQVQFPESADRQEDLFSFDIPGGREAEQTDVASAAPSGLRRSVTEAADGQVETAPDSVTEGAPVRRSQYGRFLENAKERGILLSRLDPRRWKRRVSDGKSPDHEGSTANVPANRFNISHFARTAKWLRPFIWFLGLLVLALLLMLISGVRLRHLPATDDLGTTGRTASPQAVMRTVTDSAQVPAPARSSEKSATDRFRFKVSGSQIIWQVRRGDTLYDLYLYLSSANRPAALDARLADANRLTWQEFRARIVALNPAPGGDASDLDLIFPRDQYIISR
ncbi:MAG TPA: hypothetical protein VMW73_09815 [Spirochaetia bacterium]|nr:hypothetical protein [Spirochaetia bacterium]